MKKYVEDRLVQLRKSLESIQNNANAHIGAIQELDKLLKEWDDGVSLSTETGSDTQNVSGHIS